MIFGSGNYSRSTRSSKSCYQKEEGGIKRQSEGEIERYQVNVHECVDRN